MTKSLLAFTVLPVLYACSTQPLSTPAEESSVPPLPLTDEIQSAQVELERPQPVLLCGRENVLGTHFKRTVCRRKMSAEDRVQLRRTLDEIDRNQRAQMMSGPKNVPNPY